MCVMVYRVEKARSGLILAKKKLYIVIVFVATHYVELFGRRGEVPKSMTA